MRRSFFQKSSVLAAAILMVSLAGACTIKQQGRGQSDAAADAPSSNVRIVTDDLGRRVSVPAKVTRAISLAPDLTEDIFAIGAGDRLVGDTTFCNYPESAKSITKVGDTLSPNLETIVALRPDVVFVSTASQLESFTKQLSDNQIAVFVAGADGFEGLYRVLGKMGEIFDTPEQARVVSTELQKRVQAVEDACGTGDGNGTAGTSLVKVFVQISREPLFTIGKGSFLNAVVHSAGGESVTGGIGTAFPKISKETALTLNPDAIILSDSDDNKEPNDVFANSPAVRNGRVYRINADILSRPGPRLVDALEQIAHDLHPDKFNR